MAVYARDSLLIVDAAVATASVEIAGASSYHKHQVMHSSDGTSEWDVRFECRPAVGAPWIAVSDMLELAPADPTGTIYLDGAYPELRLVYTLTAGAGALSAWLIQDDDNMNAAR